MTIYKTRKIAIILSIILGILMTQSTAFAKQNAKALYPEAAVTYRPPYPPLGQYSLPGACQPIHTDSSPAVTLKEGERLASAWKRLKTKSKGSGGIINVPWNLKTQQCDTLWLNGKKTQKVPKLTIKGIPGPNGEQPRFYCRSNRFESGTIPDNKVAGPWIYFSNITGESPELLVENIHKDGYKFGIQAGNSGKVIVRNSYFHHGFQNGFSSTNSGGKTGLQGLSVKQNFELEVCGTEVAFHGQGNTIHGFYMHRALGGGGERKDLSELGGNPSWHKITLVDSLCHDSNWSSCFKSIAQENIIINNKFYQHLETDPTYKTKGRTSQMLVDIEASCSINTIKGNEFHGWKPDAKTGSRYLVALRARRRAVRGCDIPMMYTPYGDGVTPASQLTPKKIPGPWWEDSWWTELDGKIFFPTTIENNFFKIEGPYAERMVAIAGKGTYPTHETGLGSPDCWLEVPKTWYERSRIYVQNNRYVNVNREKNYENSSQGHNYKNHCPTENAPPGPGPSKDYFEIGDGEIYE